MNSKGLTSVELCSGVGGQAIGLASAGFEPILLLDNNEATCKTIKLNRRWDVRCLDLCSSDVRASRLGLPATIDLVSGGLPRIKSSAQVGRRDDDYERRVLRYAIRFAVEVGPRAVLFENLDALVSSEKFNDERSWIRKELTDAGYRVYWNVLDAVDFGVPQNRRSGFLVALARSVPGEFHWPQPLEGPPATVGTALRDSMGSRGWPGAARWAAGVASRPGPALVGGSDARGGGDLGPSGSKDAWLKAGVDGKSLADDVPDAHFPVNGTPRITVRQAAILQGIPDEWQIFGRKTAAYRQVGHALPPPLAKAVGMELAAALAG